MSVRGAVFGKRAGRVVLVGATTAAVIGLGSAPAQAVGPPTAPRNISGTTGPGQITPTWDAPSSDGGSPILGYVATAYLFGGVAGSCAAAPAARTCTITGLGDGVGYMVEVKAHNLYGLSPGIQYAWATPVMPPSAPQTVVLTGGNRSATATWQAPTDNGGSPLTAYTATLRDINGFFVASCSALPNSPTCTFTGLGLNQSYTVGVAAQNATWVGEYAFATAVTQASRPNAPRNVTVDPVVPTAATINWQEPLFIGGAPITEYSATVRVAGTNIYAGACTTNGATFSCVVPGLQPATTHYVDVRARNLAGWSSSTRASFTTPPIVVPGAPTSVTAVPSANSIVVGWAPPASDGGAPITGYEVTVKNASTGAVVGTCSTDGAGITCTVTGLAFATTYTVEVAARNSAGLGALATVNNVRTASRPSPPTNFTANPVGTTSVTLNWQVPASTGGAAVSRYSATVRVSGSNAYAGACTVGAVLTCQIGGLTPQVSYFADLRAQNVAGWGPSTRVAFTTAAILTPSAPTSLSAVPSLGQIVVNWAPPTSDGGAPITSYLATVRNAGTGAVAGTCTTDGTGRSCTVAGLSNAATYAVQVQAGNSAGLGAAGFVSGNVSTPNRPGGPTAPVAVAGDNQILYQWAAPVSNGGSPVTNYSVTVRTQGGVYAGACTVPAAQLFCVVSGLQQGTAYVATIRAQNAVGWGPTVNFPGSVTPFAPQAPVVESEAVVITRIAPEPLSAYSGYDSTIPTLPVPEASGSAPAETEPTAPAETEPTAPAETEPTAPAETEPTPGVDGTRGSDETQTD